MVTYPTKAVPVVMKSLHAEYDPNRRSNKCDMISILHLINNFTFEFSEWKMRIKFSECSHPGSLIKHNLDLKSRFSTWTKWSSHSNPVRICSYSEKQVVHLSIYSARVQPSWKTCFWNRRDVWIHWYHAYWFLVCCPQQSEESITTETMLAWFGDSRSS